MRRLDEVPEHVLTVGAAELQAAQHLDHLRVNIRHTDFEDRSFTGPLDLLLQLLLRPFEHLFDARGVYAAVADQLLERQTGGLATDGIEAGKDDSLWSVIDDEIHPG